ncbi:MAG: hypothetical protein KGK11_09810, partial [Sphingomonadales bacterium]|nr:hypothetical protein [Sphingomonadales bacterium]
AKISFLASRDIAKNMGLSDGQLSDIEQPKISPGFVKVMKLLISATNTNSMGIDISCRWDMKPKLN